MRAIKLNFFEDHSREVNLCAERRAGRGLLRAVAIAMAALLSSAGLMMVGPSAGAYTTSWSNDTPSTAPAVLKGVSCTEASGTTTCFAVGDGGTILKKAGATVWGTQTSGTGDDLHGVSCSDASTCTAVGENGTIRRTTNGSTWSGQTSGTTALLRGVSCPTTSFCVAVGDPTSLAPTADPGVATILTTTDGGTTWTHRDGRNLAEQTANTPLPTLADVDCPSATRCYATGFSSNSLDSLATGFGGTVVATTNGGVTWNRQKAHTEYDIYGVSCTSVSNCVAVDNGGFILRKQQAVAGSAEVWTKAAPDQARINQVVADVTLDVNQLLLDVPIQIVDGLLTVLDDLANLDLDQALTDLEALVLNPALDGLDQILADLDQVIADLNGLFQLPDSLASVSCSGSSCFAVGYRGLIVAFSNPNQAVSSRSQQNWPDTAVDLAGVSCTSSTCRSVGTLTTTNSGKILAN